MNEGAVSCRECRNNEGWNFCWLNNSFIKSLERVDLDRVTRTNEISRKKLKE
jgi:hypothetical protein